jgi:hypothetical protein
MPNAGCAIVLNTGFTHLVHYQKQLPQWGVVVLPLAALEEIADGQVRLRHGLGAQSVTEPFDFVVAGIHPRPRNELREALERYAPTWTVGDVVAPRSALEAFREGDRAGRTV